MNFVHLRMRNWEILFIQIDSNLNLWKTNKQTDAYFIWWRAQVVTRHNEKISPPRQATTAWEALFLQVIKNSMMITVFLGQKKANQSNDKTGVVYWAQLPALSFPALSFLPPPSTCIYMSYDICIPVTRFQRVSIFCYWVNNEQFPFYQQQLRSDRFYQQLHTTR